MINMFFFFVHILIAMFGIPRPDRPEKPTFPMTDLTPGSIRQQTGKDPTYERKDTQKK